jgi:hypothetical protein
MLSLILKENGQGIAILRIVPTVKTSICVRMFAWDVASAKHMLQLSLEGGSSSWSSLHVKWSSFSRTREAGQFLTESSHTNQLNVTWVCDTSVFAGERRWDVCARCVLYLWYVTKPSYIALRTKSEQPTEEAPKNSQTQVSTKSRDRTAKIPTALTNRCDRSTRHHFPPIKILYSGFSSFPITEIRTGTGFSIFKLRSQKCFCDTFPLVGE